MNWMSIPATSDMVLDTPLFHGHIYVGQFMSTLSYKLHTLTVKYFSAMFQGFESCMCKMFINGVFSCVCVCLLQSFGPVQKCKGEDSERV